jgi:hypothetical protein
MAYSSDSPKLEAQDLYIADKKTSIGRIGSVAGNIGLALMRLEYCLEPLTLANGLVLKAFSPFKVPE